MHKRSSNSQLIDYVITVTQVRTNKNHTHNNDIKRSFGFGRSYGTVKSVD